MALGRHNVADVAAKEVAESQFNSWLIGKNLIVLDMKEQTAGVLNEVFKSLLASPPHFIRVNEKFLPAFEVPNIASYIMFSNAKKPLAIDDKDRRYFVYLSPAAPKPDAYYREYFGWVEDHAVDVWGYLLNRDVSAFLPKAPPPTTDAKEDLRERSKTKLELFLATALAENDAPLDRDLVALSDISHNLPHQVGKPSLRAIADILGDLGAKKLRQVRLDEKKKGGRRPWIWAIRRAEMYAQQGETQLREAFKKQRQAAKTSVVAGVISR